MKKMKNLWAGIIGAFTAATCCIAPIIIVMLGFGTALGMAVMHKLHIITIVSGIILMMLISLYLVKRESGVCNAKSVKQNWKVIAITFIIMVGAWYTINHLIIGPIAGIVYGNLDVNQKPLGNIVEMAETHGMPEMAAIEVIPEKQGKKQVVLEIEGIFCGSCGPAIEYDLKSIAGVLKVEKNGNKISVTYDSDITSKDVIVAAVHDPYSAKIISEEKKSFYE